jgi:hypothetical protein
MRRRRTGRVAVPFEVIERFAATREAQDVLGCAPDACDWRLSRASTLHRRKDGTCTLVLIWKSGAISFSATFRGLRLEAS